MEDATASAMGRLLESGLPGVVILGLCFALWKVHALYVKSQDARIDEGRQSLEKLSQAIATLDKLAK